MTKFYRVIKDYTLWEVGAIVSNQNTEAEYHAVDAVFAKELDNGKTTEGYYECSAVVENCKEFFERVYPIGELKKMLFGNKKQAQAAAAALYKGEK